MSEDLDGRPRFSNDVLHALAASHAYAIRLGNNYVGSEHLVLGLLTVEEGNASGILAALVDVEALEARISSELRGRTIEPTPRPTGSGIPLNALEVDSTLERIIAMSLESAPGPVVDGEHVLSTLFRVDCRGRELLHQSGVIAEMVTRPRSS